MGFTYVYVYIHTYVHTHQPDSVVFTSLSRIHTSSTRILNQNPQLELLQHHPSHFPLPASHLHPHPHSHSHLHQHINPSPLPTSLTFPCHHHHHHHYYYYPQKTKPIQTKPIHSPLPSDGILLLTTRYSLLKRCFLQ